MVDSCQDLIVCSSESVNEEDDRVRTIECLRGRLQAERSASKDAKEEADNLAKRLDDLEKKLAEETKFRDRADKRLQYALQKLKSLEMSDEKSRLEVPESSVGSSSSQCLSDNQVSVEADSGSSVKDSVEEETEKGIKKSVESEDGLNDDVSGSCCSVNLVCDQCLGRGEGSFEPARNEDEDSKSCDNNELAIVVFRESYSGDEKQEERTADDNESSDMLALVPVSKPRDLISKPQGGDDVQDVLLALRKVKEQLMYTMKKRATVYSQKEITTCQKNVYGAPFQCHRVSY